MEESFTYQEGQVMGWEANKPWGRVALLTLTVSVDMLNRSTFVSACCKMNFFLRLIFKYIELLSEVLADPSFFSWLHKSAHHSISQWKGEAMESYRHTCAAISAEPSACSQSLHLHQGTGRTEGKTGLLEKRDLLAAPRQS